MANTNTSELNKCENAVSFQRLFFFYLLTPLQMFPSSTFSPVLLTNDTKHNSSSVTQFDSHSSICWTHTVQNGSIFDSCSQRLAWNCHNLKLKPDNWEGETLFGETFWLVCHSGFENVTERSELEQMECFGHQPH